jgi:hypothetical protein
MKTQTLPKEIPAKLPGAVCKQYVTCGTPNCRCTRGEQHGPYWYRFWRDGEGKLHKQYVRKADLERVRAACQAWRDDTAEVRWAIGQVEDVIALLLYDEELPIEREWELMIDYPRVLQVLDDAVMGRKGSDRMAIRAFRALLPAIDYTFNREPAWMRPNYLVDLLVPPHKPWQPDDKSFAAKMRETAPELSVRWESFTGTVNVPRTMLPSP